MNPNAPPLNNFFGCDTITARRINIVDSRGTPRIVLGVVNLDGKGERAMVTLLAPDSSARIVLIAGDDGALLQFKDRGYGDQIALGFMDGHGSSLGLLDGRGACLVGMDAPPDGVGGVFANGRNLFDDGDSGKAVAR